MRSIVVFFALALLFTLGYCLTPFTAIGVLYCPSKKEWEYTVNLFGIRDINGGFEKLGKVSGKGDSQLQFYEIKGEVDMDGYSYGQFAIDIYHNCLQTKQVRYWGGVTMIAPLDGRKTYYGFTAHDLGKEKPKE